MAVKTLDPLAALKRLIAESGSQTEAGAKLGVTQAYISDLVNGRRKFSDEMLDRLGLQRIVVKR